MFLFGFSFTTFTSGFALFAERTFRWNDHPFTPREIGYLFAYAGFLGIILQGGLIGRLVKRFGEPPLVAAGFGAMGLAYLLLGSDPRRRRRSSASRRSRRSARACCGRR